ncbi:Ubiquinone biosynthesis O-methyltransferase mitochondrial [Zea mays]|uniref:Ubiquinone biosynthesis O-methyltransferase mitochondrial n=1 Tax=Zea mays TaxID=4577 RepID=A0A1D6FP60_MAIZE|nr:Ubiquinone biosynthesis O-methyltransferase mitochondrial [Zea mays]
MEQVRLRGLILGPTDAAAAPSISASRSIEVERWRSHFLVAEPCRGRQVRLHRRDLVRNEILPYFA